jgi:hypothetical protein
MSHDLALLIGTIIAGFSIPAMMSSFSDGRVPRAAALTIMIGGGLVAWSVANKPGGYTLEEIPEVFVKVTRDLIG